MPSTSFSGGIGRVLVTMTSSAAQARSRSTAGVAEDRVGRGDDDRLRAVGHQGVGGLGDGAAGVDHVVDEHADPVAHEADDPVGDHLVGPVDVAGLVDEGQRGAAEPLRPLLGDLDPPGVRGDDREVLVAVLRGDVLAEDRDRHQVVDRPVEEALDLVGVQVDADQPVGAGRLEHVGHQAGADRLAAAVLLVLAGVAVERHDHGDPLGTGPLERVDHEQVLHDALVDRVGVALDDEGVGAAHRLLEAHVDLAVGEVVGARRHQLGAELGRDLLCETGVGATREEHHLLLGPLADVRRRRSVVAHWSWPSGVVGCSVSGCRVPASSAAAAVVVPARARATQPSTLRWRPRATAI